jgi:hypothetical protein
MDVIHNAWREDKAVTDAVYIAIKLFFGGHIAVSHGSDPFR